ncbi:MAG: transcription-repair coupling factor [Armatimonadetes bacterium]|nr:transcription-repair coupling factor [Armatimonadota bacterium]
MHVRDWVRTLSPPELSSGRRLWRSLCSEAQAPLVAAAWLRAKPKDQRFLIITADYERAIQWQARLNLCGVPAPAVKQLPSGQSNLFDDAPPERVALSDRASALSALVFGEPCIVLATPQSALERALPPDRFRAATLDLKREQEVGTNDLIERLAALGYEQEEPVRRPGGYSRRGGIVDVFPAGAELPTRIEFFGDVIDSMRRFDPESQRSIKPVDSVRVPPMRPALFDSQPGDIAARILREGEKCSQDLPSEAAHELKAAIEADAASLEKRVFFDRLELYLPYLVSEKACALDYAADGYLFLDEPVELEARALRSAEGLQQALEHRHAQGETLLMDASDFLLPPERMGASANVTALSPLDATPGWLKTDGETDVGYSSLSPYRGRPQALAQAIGNWRAQGVQLIIATDQPTRAKHVLKNLELPLTEPGEDATPNEAELAGGLLIRGNLAGGFISENRKLAFLTDSELFGAGRIRMPQRRFTEGAPIASLLDLKPGDHIVHVQFGIGVYQGLVSREVAGVPKEFLRIEYRPPDTLLVPTDQLDRIQKYLSPGDAPPTIHRISGGEWSRNMRSAKKGAEDLARDLVRINAKRSRVSRPPFGEDTPWQEEMEATFQWVETPSQLSTINDVKRDLNRPYPMDRLVCGDVGFGKTEVAVRAAFKAVQAHKQVAVLCPTTVLSNQHYRTFCERLAPYPVKIGLLNRFRTAKERRAVLAGLKDGSVDIVIGTHALLQKAVEFKDLGLAVVDEEQRFGVRHKERLKDLRTSVDVLTLTATPIPRTLSMALMNMRAMSLINDPPPGRLPIRTYLKPYGDQLVREALLRELARDGQAFYVFNRVAGIRHVAERIRRMVPNARVEVAHGQMKADELEPVMLAFFHGEVDVLVCTTIIENGIDNPNVNTLIVDGADRFGLAQLYQLRGRVGRSDRQAYAYLLYRSGKHLTSNAFERLKALQEFSELGSGYALAFRDLQIRGAGELLGAKQHGLMQSVGYEMYVQLINEAVEQLKEAFEKGGESGARMASVEFGAGPESVELPAFEIPAGAYLPKNYIEQESQRLYYYKRLMEAREENQVEAVEKDLLDRYGALPEPAQATVKLVRLRLRARELGIRKVDGANGRLMAWLEKGREMPLRAVHALQRRFRGRRFRPDMAEWSYKNDALASTEELLNVLDEVIREAAQARAAARA